MHSLLYPYAPLVEERGRREGNGLFGEKFAGDVGAEEQLRSSYMSA
jgi:hypothetical protein